MDPLMWEGPLRSLLFAPATRPDFVAKLATRGADAVVIDCEDSTPAEFKEAARPAARQLAPGLVAAGCRVTVRVNAPSTEWFEQDIAESLSAELDAVVVPKLDRLEDLDRLASLLDAAGLHEIGVLVGIETALGVADARQLLAHPRAIAAYFGAEDFIVDMGGIRTESNQEVQFARAAVALAARLAGVPVLDQVVTNFRNDDRFLTEAGQARAMGFAGKLCIHPGQVELANRAFSPTELEIDRAHRLLAAYASATASGLGAVEFEGQMIDEPLAAQARRIVGLGSI